MKEQGTTSVEGILKKLDENYQKYKMMETNLAQKKRRLKQQIPDLKSTLDIVKHMHSRKEETDCIQTKFLLSGALYAKASIPPTNTVGLWLGANVMLTYTTDEALKLLTKNHTSALTNLSSVEGDLEYLRNQCTTTEVTMARLYNWDVKNRRDKKGVKSSA
jgi:prefoldin subunit 5